MKAQIHTINLDPAFRPFPALPQAATVKLIDYPSGCEPHVRLENMVDSVERLVITARIHSIADLFRVLLVKNACFHQWKGSDGWTQLFIPYLPHARQDRVAVPGDANSLEEVCRMIANNCFTKVHAFDVHNAVPVREFLPLEDHAPMALWTCAWTQEQHYLRGGRILLIHPDQGAVKRSKGKFPAYSDSLICEKHRDPIDGKLSIVVPELDVKGRVCMIIDDICDGGGTFLPIASELKQRGAERVVLCVSHGLFTKQFAALKDAGIDHIYTTNSFKDFEVYGPAFMTLLTDWSFIEPALYTDQRIYPFLHP